MILTNPEHWDHEALSEVLSYEPSFKQAANCTDISGSLLNSMRSAISAEVWSFPWDFLAVFATPGSAQPALYDQTTKYKLARDPAEAAFLSSINYAGTMSGLFFGNRAIMDGSRFRSSATISRGLCASQSDSETSSNRSARKTSMRRGPYCRYYPRSGRTLSSHESLR
jgi:hypothetical protein